MACEQACHASDLEAHSTADGNVAVDDCTIGTCRKVSRRYRAEMFSRNMSPHDLKWILAYSDPRVT